MCSGQPTQSANPVRGLWLHSVAICCRALPSPAPFRVERSESQVVKSSSASSASYSHSASSANISTICLFMHSHCVAKANALRANALWPLSSPETKPVRVGILTQPFPPSSLPSFHWKFSALPFRLCHRRTLLFLSPSHCVAPACHLATFRGPTLPFPSVRAPLQLVSHSNKTNLHVISLALLKFLNILHEMLKTLNGFPPKREGVVEGRGVYVVWVYSIWGLQLLAGSARSG